MRIVRQNAFIAISLIVFLLAGVCNLLTATPNAFVNSLMFCLSFMIHIGFILFWARSVRARIPPTKIRTYLIVSAVFMILYILQRVFRHGIVVTSVISERYSLYAYSVPRVMLPTLLLVIAFRMALGDRKMSNRLETGLLLTAAALSLMVLTNDLHFFVYRPKVPFAEFNGTSNTYSWGPGFFVQYTWMALCILVGPIIFFRVVGKRDRRLAVILGSVVFIWIAQGLIYFLVIERFNLPRMYQSAEIDCFTMIFIFESSLRSRLIPHNVNYAGFYKNMKTPILITDNELNSVHSTARPINVEREDLIKAKDGPIYPDEDTKLLSMKIRAGYAFWTENEHELHEQQKRLDEANHLLSEENDLILVENRLKEQKARLEAQDQVYERITEAIYPKQKKIEKILDDTDPEGEGFAEDLGRVCVLNAYSKRKANLLLLTEDSLPESNRELFLALAESCRFRRCLGIDAAAIGEEYTKFPLHVINDLYDSFEEVVETYQKSLKRMTVSILSNGIRIAMEVSEVLPLPDTKLPIMCKESDGIEFLTILCKEEGGAL